MRRIKTVPIEGVRKAREHIGLLQEIERLERRNRQLEDKNKKLRINSILMSSSIIGLLLINILGRLL